MNSISPGALKETCELIFNEQGHFLLFGRSEV